MCSFEGFKSKGSFVEGFALSEFEGISFVLYHPTSPGGVLYRCGESSDNNTRGDQSRQPPEE